MVRTTVMTKKLVFILLDRAATDRTALMKASRPLERSITSRLLISSIVAPRILLQIASVPTRELIATMLFLLISTHVLFH
jgi:hypothetical protein